MERLSWDKYFLMIAKLVSSRSTCLSRPAGAIIVRDKQILSTGYNGALPELEHCCDVGKCYRRTIPNSENKKLEICKSSHAEANAITFAAKLGISVNEATLYSTLEPCINCSKLIVMSGIKRVVFELPYESQDKERDVIWNSFLESNWIEVKKVELSEGEIEYSKTFLDKDTSKRRI